MNSKKKMITKDWVKYMAEFKGAFFLTFVGLGAIVLAGMGGIFAPFAFGLALLGIIYAFGAISGAHVNPAVSLAFALRRKLSWKDFAFYVLAQMLGAILGVAVLFGIYKLLNPHDAFRFAENYSTTPSAWRGIIASLVSGILFTYLFTLAWLGIVRKVENKAVAGIAIGLVLTAVLFAGAIVNPALSFAQAIFSGTLALRHVWLFVLAPLLGAILAAICSGYMFKDEEVSNEPAPQITDVKQTAKK
jgi:aquaporin Z